MLHRDAGAARFLVAHNILLSTAELQPAVLWSA